MDNNATVITDVPTTCHIPHHRISWAAIFAGAFTGLGLGFLLQLFGMAINLSAYHVGSAGAETTIAIGGFLGLLIGVFASMGTAGYVSGYLGKFHCTHHHAGAIYGFATWSLALLLAAVLMMPLSHYVSAWNNILAPHAAVSDMMSNPHEAAMDTDTEKKPANKAETPLSKAAPTTLAGSSWMLFILFFLGAFASCIGGCLGVGCRKSCTHTHHA